MAIASNRYNLQMAIQTARGVYPTKPTYFYETTGAGLVPRPTITSLDINDGRLWGPAKKRVTYIETGGEPEIMAQPAGVVPLLYGMFGALTSVPGTPNAHTITPATTLASFPYFTIWEFFDDEWRVFKDCQIVGGSFSVSVDSTWCLVKPTIIGMAPMEYSAALVSQDQATEETQNYHWLDGGGYHFIGGDPANALHKALPTDLDSLKTYLSDFKTAYNLHCAVATGLHHKAADTTNVLTYTTPITDQTAADNACADIKTAFNAHVNSTTVHYFANSDNKLTSAAPTGLSACLAFVQELQGAMANSPGAYNRHLGARAGARSFTMDVNLNSEAIQGEDIVAYTVKRKQGSVTASMDLLQEDFKLINLALFGDPKPAAGTVQTSQIQRLSMLNKFVMAGTPEVSLEFNIPQFDFDPEPIFGIAADPAGGQIVVGIGGEASGTDPVITITAKNAVASY